MTSVCPEMFWKSDGQVVYLVSTKGKGAGTEEVEEEDRCAV